METVKEKQKGKFTAFFDKQYAYFFAPIIVFVLYTVGLLCYEVFPFGGKYTIASYDLSAQICPFIEHLFAVLKGKSSLFYSHAIAGGADVTGSFLYFFISPFSLLFLVLGEGMVAHASSIVLGLKLATISFIGVWFSKTQFKGIPDYICVAIGIVYAYCGYTFVACTYINWLDFLIWLPLCAGAFAHMVRTGKTLAFSLLVSACVYTCFSIACFSMFVAFPVLVGYGVLCVDRKNRGMFITRLCLSFLTAVLFALPVLLPALSAYLSSAREGGLFDELWYGFTLTDGLPTAEFNKENYLDRFGEAMYQKWSYILSDSVFLLLTLTYFVRKGLKDRFAKFMLFAGIVTLAPVLVDEAMLLLNMGSYMSYALRFGFLNALYFLGGACLAIEGLCFRFDRAFDGTPLRGKTLMQPQNERGRVENKRSRFPAWCNGYVLALCIVTLVCFGFLIWYISNGNYKNMWLPLFENDKEMQETIKSVSGKYAHSLGGAEMVAMLLGVVAIVAFTGLVLVKKRRIGVRTLAIALALVVGVQVVFYNNQMVVGNRSTQHIDLADYRKICQTLQADDDTFFRVKDYGDKVTSNAPFTGGSNSFSVFSSVIDKKNFTVYQLFGYDGNGKNSLKSAHSENKGNKAEVFGDSFLGYKYFIVPSEDKNAVASLGYMKPYIKDGESLRAGDYYVYENTIAFPFAYKVNGGEFAFEKPNEGNASYRKANQGKLYEYLRGKTLAEMQTTTGSGSLDKVTEQTARELSAYLWGKSADVTVTKKGVNARVTAEKGEYLFLPFVALEGYRVRVNGRERLLSDNDLHFLCVALDEGENTVEFVYETPYAKDMLIGLAVGAFLLVALLFVHKKTRFFEALSPVIEWAGIALATAVLAFFMLFPTVVWIVKLFYLCV